jgi:hypothetical protein
VTKIIKHHGSRNEPRKEGRKTAHWLLLERWVNERGWNSGAEIGLQRGWTICHLLECCPALSMTGVDQWVQIPDTGAPGWDSYDHIDLDYWAGMVKERVARFGARGQVLHMHSLEAARQVADASLDFVFLDADHTDRGCSADVLAWAPKVKPTGWIAGHDWNRPEVAAVLDRLLPGWTGHGDQVWSIPRADCPHLSMARPAIPA